MPKNLEKEFISYCENQDLEASIINDPSAGGDHSDSASNDDDDDDDEMEMVD